MTEPVRIKNITHGQAVQLASLVTYAPGQVVSRTLAQNDAMSMTLFALEAGESISTHTTPGDAFVYVLDGRVILEIGVHRDDDFPAGSPEARIEGRGLAEVPAEADPANPPVGLSLSADRLPSAVRAPVVDEDDLDIQFLGVGDGRDLPAELREAGLFVLGWDHKADQGADSGGRSRRFHASTHP